ncbi:sugar transferase [Gammaproteobacteria bacterium]|nr:sugar transferase [Gammaproteobacteria bacterium]
MVLRFFDLLISIIGLLVCMPIFIVLFIACFIDTQDPIFLQIRLGKNKVPFTIFKFRTMKHGTPNIATHLVEANHITRLGKFLRKYKFDELPQLLNVFIGNMSMVGPRPCLIDQTKLISERDVLGVFSVKPGITGLAQLNGIDMEDPVQLAITDKEMLNSLNLLSYMSYVGYSSFRFFFRNPYL